MRLLIFTVLMIRALVFSYGLPEVPMSPSQREIIETALSMVGGNYGWGAYDPKNRTFDCWNFVTWVFHHVLDRDGGVKHMLIGIDDPLWVFFDDLRELQPADVLTNGGGHTVGFHAGIYYGKGFTIEARGRAYGIGIFRIEGGNPHCPFGRTRYRFCFYSLLTRLWLDERPAFHYAYLKLHQSFFFSDEGGELEFHAYSPKGGRYEFVLEILDYATMKVLRRYEFDRDLERSKELSETVHLDLGGISGYVFFRIRMIGSDGKEVFRYDTYMKGHTEII